MAGKANQRQRMIDAIIANSAVWDEGDQGILNRFSDEKLTTIYEHEGQVQNAFAIANAAVSGFEDDATGNAYRMNVETGQWERGGSNNSEMGNGKRCGTDEDDPEYEEETMNRRRRERENVSRRERTDNRRSPKTTEEWLRNAPQAVQDVYRYSMDVINREKEKIINEILTNSRVPETDRAVHAERLGRRTVEELKDDLALLPKLPVDGEEKPRNRRGRVNNARDEDMLDLPRINFSKDKDGNETTSNETTHTYNGLDDGDYMDEDEWLRNAPPQIRARVMNASRVESQERDNLLDQLTENLDEEEARRFRNRFVTRPIDELKDMLALAGNRDRTERRADYRGASGVVNQLRQAAGDPDDVLAIPRIDWAENSKLK